MPDLIIDRDALIEKAAQEVWDEEPASEGHFDAIYLALPVIVAEVLAPIEALHRPVHLVFSWHAPLRMEDPCPTCHGKAGTWECGCWGEYDRHVYCAECSATDTSHTVTMDWPCPTAQAIADIRKAVGA